MRKVIFLSVGVVFGCSLTVAGWGANGHRMIGEAAARGLPQDMLAFLRAASDQLAFLNPEPDLQRDARERAFGPWLLGSVQDHHVYEVIDPKETSFKDLDFVRSTQYLSRNKCLLVRFNSNQRNPQIEELIEELDSNEYKY